MRVVKLVLAYDGTGFRGWARQRSGVRTVQATVEESLEAVVRFPVRLAVAGRTDAGVHAAGQVASFEMPARAQEPELDRARRAVTRMLGPEVVIREASWAPEGFHARFSATAREYRYRIDTGDAPDPFTARFVWHRGGELQLPRMRAAARSLVGEHDYASFCRARGDTASTVRRLEKLAVSRRGDRVEVLARANAFCHQMVRALVGTLVSAGAGRIDPADKGAILRSRDRSAAGSMAPPHGLTLERVVYGRVQTRADGADGADGARSLERVPSQRDRGDPEL
jgi:tRNA pseudouridine38-40 synthase